MAIYEDPEGNEPAAIASANVVFTAKRVLEIGCGDGRLTKQYAHLATSVIAIDPDAEAVRRLAASLPMVDARAQTIDQLGLPASSVDLALFAWSL